MTKLWPYLLILKAVGHPRYCRRKKKPPCNIKVEDKRTAVGRFLNRNQTLFFGVDVMKLWLAAIAMTAASSFVHAADNAMRSEEHTSELQSRGHLVCRLLLEK